MTENNRDRKFVTGGYRGETGSGMRRGLEEYEKIIAQTDFVTADFDIWGTLNCAAETAAARGQKAVIFDLGCGKGLALNDIAKVRQGEFELISLTDTPGLDQVPQIEPNFRQIEAHISRSQTLDSILSGAGVDSLDLVFAIKSLMYVSPKVFIESVRACINRLQDGGKIYIVPYQFFPAAFDSENGMPFFRRLKRSDNVPTTSQQIENMSPQQRAGAVKHAYRTFFRIRKLDPATVLNDMKGINRKTWLIWIKNLARSGALETAIDKIIDEVVEHQLDVYSGAWFFLLDPLRQAESELAYQMKNVHHATKALLLRDLETELNHDRRRFDFHVGEYVVVINKLPSNRARPTLAL